jgi:fimbrial chaperone protein
MSRSLRRATCLFLTCIAILVLRSERAEAASFQVDPVSLTLNVKATSNLLAIRNLADEGVRIQIGVFQWDQTAGGDVDLAPTHDLVFFPSLLTLAPHEARNIRIAAASEASLASIAVEKTYRIIVEELLPVVSASLPNNSVRVLTKMSVPVFVQPPTTHAIPHVDKLSVRGRSASFVVLNQGTTHFMVRKIRVFVSALDGRILFDTAFGGWYVLANGTREYQIPLPATACSGAAGITVELETDQGSAQQHRDATCSVSGSP